MQTTSEKSILIERNKGQQPIFLTAVLLLLGLLPVIALFAIISEYSVNVPYWDEWELTPLVIKLHTGGITWNELWVQHNEHRILFPRLIFLALTKIGGWNTVNEIYTSFGFALLALIILWRLLVKTFSSKSSFLLLCPFSLLFFSAVQFENWTAGWQVGWYLITLCLIFAVWVLAKWPGKWFGLTLAIAATVVATYSLASAIFIWFVIAAGLVVERRAWRVSQILVWCSSAVVFLGLYFYNSVTGFLEPFYFLREPLKFSYYVMAYLGSPFGFGANENGLVISAIFGGIGLMLALLVLAVIWRKTYRTSQTKDTSFTKFLPWLELMLFAALSACMTALGRAGAFGLETATSSRYTSISILFWFGLIVGVTIVLSNYSFTGRKLLNFSIKGLLVLVAIAFLAGYLSSYLSGFTQLKLIDEQREFDQAAVYNFNRVPEDMLLSSYPDPKLLKERAWSLSQVKDSVFNPPLITYQDKLSQRISSNNYKVYNFPANLMTLIRGNQASVQPQANTFKFQQSGNETPNIWVEAALIKNYGSQSWWRGADGQILDIQSNEAIKVNIYWDTGKSLSEKEKSMIFGTKVSDAVHFKTVVPTGTKGFRIDLYYVSGRSKVEELKVNLYYK